MKVAVGSRGLVTRHKSLLIITRHAHSKDGTSLPTCPHIQQRQYHISILFMLIKYTTLISGAITYFSESG